MEEQEELPCDRKTEGGGGSVALQNITGKWSVEETGETLLDINMEVITN